MKKGILLIAWLLMPAVAFAGTILTTLDVLATQSIDASGTLNLATNFTVNASPLSFDGATNDNLVIRSTAGYRT